MLRTQVLGNSLIIKIYSADNYNVLNWTKIVLIEEAGRTDISHLTIYNDIDSHGKLNWQLFLPSGQKISKENKITKP